MNLKIKNIILWPKDQSKNIRILEFDLDKINIITGESHSGKSALIHIIDYCLGSEKCTIPVGEIRQKTDWFIIHAILEDTEILLGRPEPGNNISTGDMFFIEEVNVDRKMKPFKNSNRKNVINRLNQVAKFSTLDFNYDESSSYFKDRASFRDTSAFQFQPQHIIANPFTLYYKADTYEHQEKLRTIFPLILGVIDNEALSLQHELTLLENELKSKKRILSTKAKASEVWINNLKGLYEKSKELGLIKDSGIRTENWEINNYLFHLNLLLEQFKEDPIPKIRIGATEKAVSILDSLLKQEDVLAYEISIRRRKLTKIVQLNDTGKKHDSILKEQTDRLEPIKWFREKVNGEACPFCQSINKTSAIAVSNLNEALVEFESISSITGNGGILDKEILELKKEIHNFENQLNFIRDHIKELSNESNSIKKERQRIEDVYKFIGRLEQSLDNLHSIEDDSELNLVINNLEDQINKIRSRLNEKQGKINLENIIIKISTLISKYVETLDIDKPKDIVKIDIKNLTLKIFSEEDNRDNFLWEIGSGANWMGYHISTLLALHEYFLSLKNNHIPSFLMMDQPSQVYFPEKWPSEEQISQKTEDSEKYSKDLLQVKKIFKALVLGRDRTEGRLQIILFEHAPAIAWEGLENINLVEEWRNGEALIPKDWL